MPIQDEDVAFWIISDLPLLFILQLIHQEVKNDNRQDREPYGQAPEPRILEHLDQHLHLQC